MLALRRGSEELLPIYRSCVFRSDERSGSHDHIANELSEHTLDWKRGAVDVAMFTGRLQRLKLYVLRYGAEVEVKPRPFDDFALVHMSLRGATEIVSDGVRVDVAEGRAAIVAPRNDLRLRWHVGTEQLIVKVPLSLLDEVRQDGIDKAAALQPASLIPTRLTTQWDLLMRSLLNAVRLPDEASLDSSWLHHFERNIALFLLAHQSSETPATQAGAAAATLPIETGENATADAKRMEAMARYMQQRLGAPISLFDLAAAAGVSERTLNSLCHRHFGETPMNLLRNMRLDAVRARLKARPDLNVTTVALEYGFGHVGRFASYYAERFGELPRRTVWNTGRGAA